MADGEAPCECPADLPCVGEAVGLLVGVTLLDGAGVPGVGVAPGRDEAGGWPGPLPPDADEPDRPVPPDPESPGLDLPPPSGWLPCPGAADEGGCGAAHCVNGAFGPPDIATTRAQRQTAITAMVPNPANRKTW